jgi:HSP20 family protein
VKREQYHRVERAYGTFSRAFTLPSVVDTEKIKAEFTKDGLLRVTLPKRDEAKPKQISIAVTK